MMFLLDTDMLIYSLKGHESVVKSLEIHQQDFLGISVVSLLELYYGAFKSEKKTANLAKVRRIEEAFDILPVGFPVAETFGLIKSDLEFQGTPLDDFDLIIAATALTSNLTLVSNNQKHFSRIEGLRLENWARF